jgi:hypothetical protein
VSAEGASTCGAVINIIELQRERRTAHPARIFYHTPCHAPIISHPLLFLEKKSAKSLLTCAKSQQKKNLRQKKTSAL